MTLRVVTCFVAGAIAMIAPAEARAERNTARLVFLRGHGTETCPGEDALHEAVTARLGYDPFSLWARDTLFAELSREGSAFVGRVKLVTPENVVRGERTMRTNGRCDDLVPTLGLTISLAIDPMAGTREVDDAPPVERPVVPPSAEAAPAPPGAQAEPDAAPAPEPTSKAAPLKLAAGLGAIGMLGSAPSLAPGGVLFGRARWRDLSLTIEARADLPASAGATGGGEVASSIVAGSIVPCAHTAQFFACPRATLGVFSGHGNDLPRTQSSSEPWAEVGGRLGYELELDGPWAVRLHLDGAVVLTRYALRIDQEKVFEHAPLTGGAGVAVVARLP